MNAQEAYEAHLPTIMAIADEEIVAPSLPTEEALAEAERLALIAQRDREALIQAGIEAELIDSLSHRIGAFAFAASNHLLSKEGKSELQQQWSELEPKGFELRRELIHHYRFAYRKESEISKKLACITSGRGRKDMIYDLLSLYQLGTEHPEPLTKINFDMALLEEAKGQFDNLSNIFAASQITPESIDEVRVIKNKSHTWLYQATSEIKEHGKFIFWKDEDKLRDYISEYRSSNRKKSN